MTGFLAGLSALACTPPRPSLSGGPPTCLCNLYLLTNVHRVFNRLFCSDRSSALLVTCQPIISHSCVTCLPCQGCSPPPPSDQMECHSGCLRQLGNAFAGLQGLHLPPVPSIVCCTFMDRPSQLPRLPKAIGLAGYLQTIWLRDISQSPLQVNILFSFSQVPGHFGRLPDGSPTAACPAAVQALFFNRFAACLATVSGASPLMCWDHH